MRSRNLNSLLYFTITAAVISVLCALTWPEHFLRETPDHLVAVGFFLIACWGFHELGHYRATKRILKALTESNGDET